MLIVVLLSFASLMAVQSQGPPKALGPKSRNRPLESNLTLDQGPFPTNSRPNAVVATVVTLQNVNTSGMNQAQIRFAIESYLASRAFTTHPGNVILLWTTYPTSAIVYSITGSRLTETLGVPFVAVVVPLVPIPDNGQPFTITTMAMTPSLGVILQALTAPSPFYRNVTLVSHRAVNDAAPSVYRSVFALHTGTTPLVDVLLSVSQLLVAGGVLEGVTFLELAVNSTVLYKCDRRKILGGTGIPGRIVRNRRDAIHDVPYPYLAILAVVPLSISLSSFAAYWAGARMRK